MSDEAASWAAHAMTATDKALASEISPAWSVPEEDREALREFLTAMIEVARAPDFHDFETASPFADTEDGRQQIAAAERMLAALEDE